MSPAGGSSIRVSSEIDDYEPQEVDAMMQQLWAEYVAAHPDLFRADDKADDQKP